MTIFGFDYIQLSSI
ncbi:unnamed protein product [Fusarium venenatum]|uniref:Uncharacterized protein n=1 Tax=Fusarium venenatum TaxID=56646 RepID=A0A2L2TAY6_9HYPO|nr:unnamed protein product [Fusarium venenatum]